MPAGSESVNPVAADRIRGADVARSRGRARPAPIPDGSLATTRDRVARQRALKPDCLASDGQSAGRCGCILDCAWFKSAQGCRRRNPRHPGLLLDDAERHRLRGMLSRAQACGTRYVSLRRITESAGRLVEGRLVVQAPCGMRVCPKCDQEMRWRHAKRSEGQWTQFHTLGVPHSFGTLREAWRKIGACVKALMHELRRSYRDEPGINIRVSRPGLKDIARLNASLEPGRRKLSDFAYAWCVESHESGYPHLHFVTNTARIDYAWLRALWGRITGCSIRWHDSRSVYSVKGVCRYLSTYIAKAHFYPDINAVMFRKRLHYSTMPKEFVPPDGWTPERKESQSAVKSLTALDSSLRDIERWNVVLISPGKYAMMERDLGPSLGDQSAYNQLFRLIPKYYNGSEMLWTDMCAVLVAKIRGVWSGRMHHKSRARIRLTHVDKQKLPG